MHIGVLLLSFILLYIEVGSAQRCSNYSPCEFKINEPLRHPKQLLSTKQHLEVALNVQMEEVTVGGWLRLWRRTYNGQISGPTLRVRSGDTITVNLINRLEPNVPGTAASNKQTLANSTNLYLHGLHVSPKTNDASIRVDPGEQQKYTFTIDCDHPAGTYWYHPHLHGSTMFQTSSGMAGMIVVEDDVRKSHDAGPISALSCPHNCDHEIQLVFQPTMLYRSGNKEFSFVEAQKQINDDEKFRNLEKLSDDSKLEDWLTDPENNVHHFTVNGQLKPRIRIEAGKTMRIRMVNAGGIHALEIGVPTKDTGASCSVHEIARDGIYLGHPREPQNGQTIIPQGGTADWLIECQLAGIYKVASTPNPANNPGLSDDIRFKGLLATIEVVQETPKYRKSMLAAIFEEKPPMVLPSRPKYLPNLRKVRETVITGKFVLEAASSNVLNRETLPVEKRPIRYKMTSGGLQEWTLLNADPTNSHTLHTQGNHFQVISSNEYRGPISVATSEGYQHMVDQNGNTCNSVRTLLLSGLLPKIFSLKKSGILGQKQTSFNSPILSEVGDWMNTIILPPLSNITIRFIPRQLGKILLHSSNLLRDDLGMKINVEIVGKGEQIGVSSFGNSGRPGTCRRKDFYPTVSPPSISVTADTLKNFFSWLYKHKPAYRKKYGDQRYISRLYGAYLKETGAQFSNGSHLKNFFDWTYKKFPSYKQHYGDQSYLHELYDYYIIHNIPLLQTKNRLE